MPRVGHLVSRFFTSLHPRPLDAETMAWIANVLRADELRAWETLDGADRAESVAVARRFERALTGTDTGTGTGTGTGERAEAAWVASALLHDVGKVASAYGPIGRSIATVVVGIAGDDAARRWATAPGRVRARIGRYAAHDDLGAALLRRAGARPEAAAWAEAHHRPGRWATTGIPLEVCRALATADGESGS